MGVAEIDLRQPRDPSALVGATLRLFGRHAPLFLAVTALVVAPVVLLVDGVWGREFAAGPDAVPSPGAAVVSGVLQAVVVPSLVTALHVRIVQALGRGEVPRPGAALRSAVTVLPAAAGAVLLYTLVTGVGFLLLIVPGVWLSVRLYFGAQAAVVDGVGPVGALRASAQLVDGRWWPTAGRLLLAGIVFAAMLVPLGVLAALVEDGVAFTLLDLLLQTVEASLTALFGTLAFFDLRARAADPGWLPPRSPFVH